MSVSEIHPAWPRLIEPADPASSNAVARVSQLFRDGAEVEAVEELVTQIDDSHYSPSDWIVALAAFDQWLEKQSVEARPLQSMTGYLHCCTLTSAETLAAPALDDLLRKMLEEFGFDASQAAQSS